MAFDWAKRNTDGSEGSGVKCDGDSIGLLRRLSRVGVLDAVDGVEGILLAIY